MRFILWGKERRENQTPICGHSLVGLGAIHMQAKIEIGAYWLQTNLLNWY